MATGHKQYGYISVRKTDKYLPLIADTDKIKKCFLSFCIFTSSLNTSRTCIANCNHVSLWNFFFFFFLFFTQDWGTSIDWGSFGLAGETEIWICQAWADIVYYEHSDICHRLQYFFHNIELLCASLPERNQPECILNFTSISYSVISNAPDVAGCFVAFVIHSLRQSSNLKVLIYIILLYKSVFFCRER